MPGIPRRLATALAGRYRLERTLGVGGMATVYLAEDHKLGRRVAVKVLRPELAAAIGPARFVREIEIVARLNHPHILMLIDSGETEGFLYYVMPFVNGESLEQRLQREGRLSVNKAVGIIAQVASALSYAHQQGVIHRDVKPANILLSDDQAVVADFGVARALEVAGGEKLTSTGMAVGTPAYMSPEQAFGHEHVDGRTDVYALGCVLFEMLAGRPPFEAATPQALLAQHASQSAPSLGALVPEVPLFLERAVGQALAKDAGQRFASPIQLAETLRSETVVARVGRRRLAVLPPATIGDDSEQQHLMLGLHEALIGQLGQGDVAVLARTSVLQYRDAPKPVRDVCRELMVDAVVESSLLRSGDAVGVQVRLIDGQSEEGLWAGSFDGNIATVFALYREAGDALAREVHGALAAKATRPGPVPVIDPAAYEKYMRGRVHQQSFNPHDLDRAMQYYEAALAIQPDCAPAYAGMALIWGSKAVLGLAPPLEAGPRWKEAALRAVALDPQLAEGHQALAQGLVWFEYDWVRGEAAFRRAIELDPDEPQARIFYAHFLAMMQRAAESDEQIARALEIDPFNPFTQLLYGAQLFLLGRHQAAIEQLKRLPANPLRSHGLTFAHFRLGQRAEGMAHYVDYFRLLGDQELVAALEDRTDGIEAALLRGGAALAARAEATYVKPNNLAYLHLWGGDHDRALAWAERAAEQHDHEVAYWGALGHPMQQLGGHRRFRDLLRRLELPLPPEPGDES